MKREGGRDGGCGDLQPGSRSMKPARKKFFARGAARDGIRSRRRVPFSDRFGLFGRLAGMTASAAVLLAAALTMLSVPRIAHASCNLIPGSTLEFGGAVESATRPFAGPGEHVEVSLGVSAGAYIPTEYRASVFYKPDALSASHLVVVTDVRGDGCDTLCSAPPASVGFDHACTINLVSAPVTGASLCVEMGPAGIEARPINGDMFLSFRMPDPENPSVFGSRVAGPAAIAITEAADPLPDLSVTDCASLSGATACVDEISGDATFPFFTALPRPNDFAMECMGETPPCVASPTDIKIAFDAEGNALIPWDWSAILVRHEGRPLPRLVTATLKLPFTIPSDEYVSSFSPEGGVLAPIFEPQFDPTAPAGQITLFGSADAPYTILRIARGALGTGSGSGTGCLAPIYDPAVDFPGSAAGSIAVPNDGSSVCGSASPRVCLLEAGMAVALQAAAETDDLRVHLVDEIVDGVGRNADPDALDETVVLQDRLTGEFLDLGTPSECGMFAPGAVARATEMVNEPSFIDLSNPPPMPFAFAGVAAEENILASIESEFGENCDINATGAGTDAVLRMYQVTGGSVPVDLTAGGACPLAGTAGFAVDAAPVIDDKAIAVTNKRAVFRGYPSGTVGSGPLTLNVLDALGCSMTDLGSAVGASVSSGNVAYLAEPATAGFYPIEVFRTGGAGSSGTGRHGASVSLDGRWLAALVSEAVASVDDNGDADMTDTVVRVFDLATGVPVANAIAQAATHVEASGDFIVVRTSEAAEGAGDLNGDFDATDFVLQAYNANCPTGPDSACLVTTNSQATALFEVGEFDTGNCGAAHLVAYAVREADEGNTDLNSDGDMLDDVLHVLNLLTGQVTNVGRSVVPCTFAECDPRFAWKVEGSTVTFLTDEADESADLDGDGSVDDVVVTVWDDCTGLKKTVSSVSGTYFMDTCTSDLRRVQVGVGGIEDGRGEEEQGESVVVVTDAGRCTVDGTGSCTAGGVCPAGSYCDIGECCPISGACLNFPDVACATNDDCSQCALLHPGSCRTNPCGGSSDCPTGSSCSRSSVVAVLDTQSVGESALLEKQDVPPKCIGDSFDCVSGVSPDGPCAQKLSKTFAKYVRTADKIVQKCHKKRNREAEQAFVDCNDIDSIDTKGKLGKAALKLDKAAEQFCGSANFAAENLSCPAPCTNTAGSGFEVVDENDLAHCLACLGQSFIEDRGEQLLGMPDVPLAGKLEEKCHSAVAKSYSKHLTAVLKNRDECANSASCSATQADDKSVRAAEKAADKIEKACGNVVDIAALDLCANSVAGVALCAPELSAPCGPSPWCLSACASTTVSTTTTTTICTTTTTMPERLIFATNAAYSGDVGGLPGADEACQLAAAQAGLPGIYLAWMCDGVTDPATRNTQSATPYVLPDGTMVAVDWADLTDGTLVNGIDRDEFGLDITGVPPDIAWTYVDFDGTCSTAQYPSPGAGPCPPATNCPANCGNDPLQPDGGWTTGDPLAEGATGSIGDATGGWTQSPGQTCDTAARLYCVQQ